MDKLDSYGDNFRNIPICVPNETENDAKLFKEIIATKNLSGYLPYFHNDDPNSNSISSFSATVSNSVPGWKGNSYESVNVWNSTVPYGHKKSKKQLKKERKEAKR